MTLVSYAQNFEDVMLWRALKHVQSGFYIDVGAQHPIIDSVSKHFHVHGWHGIHIEPIQNYAKLLQQDRPDEIVIQAALSDSRDRLSLYHIPGTGLSTLDVGIAAMHRDKGFTTEETTVTCLTLADVFDQAGPREVHWLKIDVEGAERQVLAGWASAVTKPWLVVIESTLPLTQIESHHAWEAELLARGYQFIYFDGLNRFYVSTQHPELVEAFNTPPNFFDGFTLSGTANSPFCALLNTKLEHLERHYQQQIAQIRSEQAEREQALTLELAALQKQLLQ